MRLPGKPSLRRALLVVGLGLLGGAAVLVLLTPSCLAAGTRVDTPSGPRAIETLEAGDAVWTEGPSGREPGRVVRRMGAWATSHLELRFSGGETLRATDVHPIATSEGWTPAGRLKPGDALRGGNVVLSVERRTSLLRVYDLEVEPHSNFFAEGILVHNKTSVRASQERNAAACLKTVMNAEADFRSNDRDANHIEDYWVGDVETLYTMKYEGFEMKLIEISVAEADAAPLKPRETKPKAGYVYAVVPERADGTPLGADTDRDGKPDRAPDAFAFCAWPANYGSGGRMTFIVSQDFVIWKKDTGRGARLPRWPKDPAAEGWTKLD